MSEFRLLTVDIGNFTDYCPSVYSSHARVWGTAQHSLKRLETIAES